MTRAALAIALVLLGCGGSGSPPPARDPSHDPSAGPFTDPGRPPSVAPGGANPITAENALTGSSGWNLRIRATQHQIEGYALAVSAAPGEAVPIAVSVNPGPAQFSWIVYRIGYYGGIGAREIQRGGPVTASAQPRCPMEAGTGLVACAWPPAFTLQTGSDWITGIYLVRMVRADGWETWVPLVLRYPGSAPEVVMIVPTATSQAYNDFQGESLYTDQNRATGRGRAFKVSYDRPYAMGFGAGYLVRWDQLVARFLERTGENVGYVTDEDVDRDPSVLDGARAVVLSGHDEYWSGAIRTAVDAAVARGTSLLLLGANAAYWQIRYEPSADGRARRVITAYKDDAPRLDPVGPNSPSLTTQFRLAPVSRPENALFGVMFQDWNSFGFGAVVRNPEHWAFAGTGLAAGDVLPLVGGYEVDATNANGAEPPGVEILAEAPLLGLKGGMATGQMVIRQQGASLVFAAGGIDFASALDGEHADPRVQRITANVLARALGRAPDPSPVSFAAPVALGPFATRVTTAAGVAFQPGSDDGPPGTGRLHQPIAVAVLPGGAVAILDRGDRSIRRLDSSGWLSTLAAVPNVSRPSGLAADATGKLYVSDAWNGTITLVDGPGSVSTFATGLLSPTGLAISGGALYVAETGGGAIRRIDLATRSSTALTTAIYNPTGVAVATDGTVYAIETGYQRVVRLSGTSVAQVAGNDPGFVDGPAAQARLLPQLGLLALSDGSLVVADPGNLRVRAIRAGQVWTLAGSGTHGACDGRGDVAQLGLPAGLAVDGAGRIYVADPATSTVRMVIR